MAARQQPSHHRKTIGVRRKGRVIGLAGSFTGPPSSNIAGQEALLAHAFPGGTEPNMVVADHCTPVQPAAGAVVDP